MDIEIQIYTRNIGQELSTQPIGDSLRYFTEHAETGDIYIASGETGINHQELIVAAGLDTNLVKTTGEAGYLASTMEDNEILLCREASTIRYIYPNMDARQQVARRIADTMGGTARPHPKHQDEIIVSW